MGCFPLCHRLASVPPPCPQGGHRVTQLLQRVYNRTVLVLSCQIIIVRKVRTASGPLYRDFRLSLSPCSVAFPDLVLSAIVLVQERVRKTPCICLCKLDLAVNKMPDARRCFEQRPPVRLSFFVLFVPDVVVCQPRQCKWFVSPDTKADPITDIKLIDQELVRGGGRYF